MIEFKMRPNDQLGSYAAMIWRDTDTGDRGIVFRFPSEWYDDILQIMQDNQEEVRRSYEHYKSWPERMKQRKTTVV